MRSMRAPDLCLMIVCGYRSPSFEPAHTRSPGEHEHGNLGVDRGRTGGGLYRQPNHQPERRGLHPRRDTGDYRGLVGGAIFTRLGYAGVTGVNLWSILVAIVGAVIVLVIYHAIMGARAA
jgi:hypothetical protein